MHFPNPTFFSAVAVALSLVPGQAIAQPVNAKPAKTATGTAAPRTVDGQPDLQGVWANNNVTPLERPKALAGRPYLTEQELAALKKKGSELFDNGSSDAAFGDTVFESVLANVKGEKAGFKSTDGETGDYSSVWLVSRDWDNRTSLITDPSDGRLPPLTPEAANKRAAANAVRNRLPAGPEDRSLSERCITFGSPRLGAGYNSYFQILQSPKEVVILMETIHDARVIPLDGSPHLPTNIRTWLGDARGHWDGETLVVDTTNYKPGVFMNISTEKLHVVERFTRTGADTLKWEITVNDPGAWSKPWTAMIPLRHSKDALFEYACQEGNYGLEGILAGARAEEKAAVAAKTSHSQ
ncbi:MAG TPA: hypothetical protein VG096_02060 [Bryobacteraceae bacterium]|jgi:hypothetical protein|nr:hypothetical protein [Bryobacteraceae bacterium]